MHNPMVCKVSKKTVPKNRGPAAIIEQFHFEMALADAHRAGASAIYLRG
jgi:hypothetical protein